MLLVDSFLRTIENFFISRVNNLLKRQNKSNGGGVWYKEERVSEHI